MIVPGQGQRPTEEQLQALRDAEAKRAQVEQLRAQAEQQRAQVEAGRAAVEKEKTKVEAERHKALAKQMEAWNQSEQMKKWREDMAAWGQKMGRWGQELASWQTGASADSFEQPAMPAMPPMPAVPPMPPVSVAVPEVSIQPVPPIAGEKQDGREQAVSRLEQTIDLSAKVQAKANIGSIQSDLPLEVTKPRGVATGSSASGTIGEGQGELSLKTNVGSIQIRSQGAEPRRAGRSRPEPKPRPEPRSEPAPEREF